MEIFHQLGFWGTLSVAVIAAGTIGAGSFMLLRKFRGQPSLAERVNLPS